MKMLQKFFIDEIAQRIPNNTERVSALSDILSMNKKSVYRRLSGEIPFTFDEAFVISQQLNISLDSLEFVDTVKSDSLFKLNLIEYVNPVKSDFALLQEMVSILKVLKNVPDAEAGEITNILPQPLYAAYGNIFRYYLFKWKYQTKRFNKATHYKDIIISNRLQKIQNENVKWSKILHTDYIFDNLIFSYLVNDIRFFYNIELITDEEVESIKHDLLRILDKMNIWARTGIFEETGKRINIYVSNVNFDASYIYLDAGPDYQLTIAKVFLLNGIASTEKRTFEELKYWAGAVRQQSVLITGCNEKERVKYFDEQRAIIESLSLFKQ